MMQGSAAANLIGGLVCGLFALVLVLGVAGGVKSSDGEGEYAFVLTTDYWSAAYYSTIEISPPRVTEISIAPVSTDPVAYYCYEEDMVFVVNRYGADNIQVVDPRMGFATTGQYSVGGGSNPHDIRLASSEKAYVSRFEWKTLLMVHPYTGDSLGTIDLSTLADPDGIPEMDRMEMVGDRLFVTLNCIDHMTWLPNGPAKIAVVDTQADTLIDCDPDVAGKQGITLQLPNPYSELRYDRCGGYLVVTCLGAWGDLEGGVEIIDPESLQTVRVAITEAQAGGDLSDALICPSGKGYAVVLDTMPWPDNFARLVTFDSATGVLLDTLYCQTSGSGSSLGTIEANRQGEIFLCDRDATHPGIRIYDTTADTLIVFKDVGLPPFDIAFVQMASAGLRDDGRTGAPGVCLRPIHPNPFTSSTVIRYTISPKAGPVPVCISIHDVLGRRVHTLVDEIRPPGIHSAAWDGRDIAGGPVACGVYFCRLQSPLGTETTTIILVR
jgi:hypothetical protein